jgi:vitamin B12 transport system permease protein
MPILPNLIDGRGKVPRLALYYAAWRLPMPAHIRSTRSNLKGQRLRQGLRAGTPRYDDGFTPEKSRVRCPDRFPLFMNARAAFSLLFAVLSAVMLGLAAGAVWMVPTLYLQQAMPWLALPAGWLLGKATRHWVRSAGGTAALLAALATLIAAFYVNLLMAGARIAGLMGLGLIDALRTAGFDLLLQLAELGQGRMDDLWYVIGMGIAAFVAMRADRPPKAGA